MASSPRRDGSKAMDSIGEIRAQECPDGDDLNRDGGDPDGRRKL